MEIKGVIKYLCFLIFSISIITACSYKIKEIPRDIEMPKLGLITVLETAGDKCNVYRAESGGLYKIGSGMPKAGDMTYNSSTVVQLAAIANGQNLEHNNIKIYMKEKMLVLDSFYSASDLCLNPSGNKLAYRSYKEDSLESAQGLKIFDINARKLINLKSKVLVSGNVYGWLDDNNIIYYGSTGEKQDSGRIYQYNLQNNTEKVYLDNIDGYCTYMVPAGKGLVYMKENENGSELLYFNDGGNTVLSREISRVYKARYLNNFDKIFFTGMENGVEEPELYSISLKGGNLTRITYDFPGTMDTGSNICFDKQGNIYFTALQGVYMYNLPDNSVNLISTHNGKYSVYQNIQN